MPRGKRVSLPPEPEAHLPVPAFSPRPMASVTIGVPGPAEWQAMREMAAVLAKTEFVPRGLAHRPDAVLAAIMKGRELGIGPMQALSQITVIQGKPTISAELMMALIRRAGHSIEVTEESDTAVTVESRRADTHDHHTEKWDIDRAKQAGLMEKDNWKLYTKAMLRARAISATGRFLFPDVLLGASYVPEELEGSKVNNGDSNAGVTEPSPPSVPAPDISSTERAAAALLGNSLERRWPAGKYKARFEANDNEFEAMFKELEAEHAVEHGPDCQHVKSARALLEEEA